MKTTNYIEHKLFLADWMSSLCWMTSYLPGWRQLWMWVTALTHSSNGAGITGMWLDVEACDHDLSFTLCTYCWTYLHMHNTSMFLDTTLDIYTHPDHRLLLVTSEAALLPRPGLQETYCYIRGRNIWYLDNILITSRTIFTSASQLRWVKQGR